MVLKEEITQKKEEIHMKEKVNKMEEIKVEAIKPEDAVIFIEEVNQNGENKLEKNNDREKVIQGEICHIEKIDYIEEINQTDVSSVINEVNQKGVLERIEGVKQEETNQKEVVNLMGDVNLRVEVSRKEEINQKEILDQRQVSQKVEVYMITETKQNDDVSQVEGTQKEVVNNEAINQIEHYENGMLKVSNDNSDASNSIRQTLTYTQRKNLRRKAKKALLKKLAMSEMVKHPAVPVVVPNYAHRADLVPKGADKVDLVPKSAHKVDLVSKDTDRAVGQRADLVQPNPYLCHMANLFPELAPSFSTPCSNRAENSEHSQRADCLPQPTPSFSSPSAKRHGKKKKPSLRGDPKPVSDPQRPMNSEPRHRADLLPKSGSGPKIGPRQSNPSHRADLLPEPASRANRPRHSEPDHQFASSHNLQAASCKVTLMPVDYPATLLTSQQAEDIRDKLTFMIDQLDIKEGLHPQFSGFSLKSGACVLCCDSQNSKAWLINSIGKISINNNVKLRISGLHEIYQNVKMGGFFPGKMVPDNMLLRRLGVQNHNVPGIKKWIVIGGKMENRGFFGVLRIPITSIKFLEKQNLQVSYGMSKVKLKYLESKGSYNKKIGKPKEGSNSIKDESIFSTESDRKITAPPYHKMLRTNKVPDSDIEDYRNLGSSFNDNALEFVKSKRSARTQSKITKAWMSEDCNGFPCSKSESGTGCESDNYHGPVNTEAEIGFTWESDNYGRSESRRTEREASRESVDYHEHIISRSERGVTCRPKRLDTESDVEPRYTGPKRRMSKNYDDTPHKRSERETTWQSDRYVRSHRSGTERESDNYHSTVSFKSESENVWDSDSYNGAPGVRTKGRESDIYTGPTNMRHIEGSSQEFCNYSRPNCIGTEERGGIDNYGRPVAIGPEERATSGNHSRPASIRPEQRAAFVHYGRPASMEPEGRASWESDNYSGPDKTRREEGTARIFDNHRRPTSITVERGVAWKSDNYGEPGGSIPEEGSIWNPDNYGGSPRMRPEETAAWPSGNYREPFVSERERGIDWKSENYNGPASIKSKGGVACEPDNYRGPDSTRHNRGTSGKSDNYGGHVRSKFERGAAWESANYGSPVENFPVTEDVRKPGNNLGIANVRHESGFSLEFGHFGHPVDKFPVAADALESEDYGGPVNIIQESLPYSSYCGPASSRPESRIIREIDNFGWPASTKHETGVNYNESITTRPTRTDELNLVYQEKPVRNRTEMSEEWEPNNQNSASKISERSNFDRPKKTRCDRPGEKEYGEDYRNERSRPETSRWKSAHSDGHDWTGRVKTVGDCRAGRSRSETRRRMSAHDDRHGRTRHEKSSRECRRRL